jgi:hypothetical protein
MAETVDPPDLSEPPRLPDLPRRVRLYPGQWIGIPLLVLMPVLAIFGVFGETRSKVDATGAAVRLEVDYPTRLRDGKWSEVQVRIRNASGDVLDDVTVTFDDAYLRHFARVTFTPVLSLPLAVELNDLQPGETSVVRVEFHGNRPWRGRGRIAATHRGDTAAVLISTFTFP